MRLHATSLLAAVSASALLSTLLQADVGSLLNPSVRWEVPVLGTPVHVEASIEGDAFMVCSNVTSTNFIMSVHDIDDGNLVDIATLSALSLESTSYSSEANRLAVGFLSVDGLWRTRLYDTTTQLPLGEFSGSQFAFDSTGTYMVVGGEDVYLSLVRLQTGKVIRGYLCDLIPNDIVVDSIDGVDGVVGACGEDGWMRVWDLATTDVRFDIEPTLGTADFETMGIAPGCTYVGGGSGGDSAESQDNGRVKVYRVDDGALSYDQQVATGGLQSIQFTEDDDEIIMLGTSVDGEIILTAWDLTTGQTFGSITDQNTNTGVLGFSYSPTENVLAIIRNDVAGPRLIVLEPNACSIDLDHDGVIAGGDLAALLGQWGEGATTADLDGSGGVDGADLNLLLGAWGTCGG